MKARYPLFICMLTLGVSVSGSGETITGFTPNAGLPGTTVTINISGLNAPSTLYGVTSVSFGGTASSSFSLSSSNNVVTATVPAGAASGVISLQGYATPYPCPCTPTYFSISSANQFFVPPTISSLTPSSGYTGSNVTISGSSFLNASSVTYNGSSVSFVVVSAGSITTSVPSRAISGTFVVSSPSGSATSSTFTVTNPPTLTSATPATTPPGSGVIVTLAGSHFSGATAVTFNGVSATFNVVSDTSLTTTIPCGSTNGNVSVTTPFGSGSLPFATSDIACRVSVSATSGYQQSIAFPSPTTSWTVQYQFVVPPLPNTSTWNPNTQTVYIWGDIDYQFYTNGGELKDGYAINQLVPEIMIGKSDYNFTGNYSPEVKVFTSWVAQAAYFWGNSAGQNFIDTPGTWVNVNPGDVVVTTISYNATSGSITLSITDTSIGGNNGSSLEVAAPYLDTMPYKSWTDYFTQAVAAEPSIYKGILYGRPQLSVESHGVDSSTLCNVLPWLIQGVSLFPGVANATNYNSAMYAQSNAGPFSCSNVESYAPPDITGFSPSSANPGTQITLNGNYLSGVSAVRFNGVSASFTPISNVRVTAIVPSNASSGSITLVTPYGTATSVSGFSVK